MIIIIKILIKNKYHRRRRPHRHRLHRHHHYYYYSCVMDGFAPAHKTYMEPDTQTHATINPTTKQTKIKKKHKCQQPRGERRLI